MVLHRGGLGHVRGQGHERGGGEEEKVEGSRHFLCLLLIELSISMVANVYVFEILGVSIYTLVEKEEHAGLNEASCFKRAFTRVE